MYFFYLSILLKNRKQYQKGTSGVYIHDGFDFVLTTIVEPCVREIEDDSIIYSGITKARLCGHGVHVNSIYHAAPESLQLFYVYLPILELTL